MNGFGRWLAALVVALLLVAPAAADVNYGVTPSNGRPAAGPLPYNWNGTSWVPNAGDPNGIQRVTEEYPITSQRVSYAAVVAGAAGSTQGAVYNGLKSLGNGYGVGPYGYRAIHVQRTPGAAGSGMTKLYIYSSDDNVTFKPLIVPSSTNGADFLGSYADTTKMDTLEIRLPNLPQSLDAWYALPNNFHMGRYVQFWGSRTDSTGTSSTTNLSLTWELREQ